MRYIAVTILTLFSISTSVKAQFQNKKQIESSRRLDAKKSITVVIANVNGGIEVNGENNNEISLKGEAAVYAKSQDKLNDIMSEVDFGMIDRADTLIYYLKGYCGYFEKSNNRWRKNSRTSWSYNWDDDCEKTYDLNVTLNVSVPVNVNLVVSTINNGDISISNIKGITHVSNINGSISLNDCTNKIDARTINGDLNLENIQLKSNASFYTLNGDINANISQKIDAEISFESFNGDFYTNVQDVVVNPRRVKKIKDGNLTKMEVKSTMKMGSGGVPVSFETFNGNVYLKENL